MSGFCEAQIRVLSGKLSPKHIKTRRASDGKSLLYLEGWHLIAEANRIFGFDAWDRQTLATDCVHQGAAPQRQHACSYIARVRVTARANGTRVCREASGSGHATCPTSGEAHERALKAAETDAMKRALMTFGNLFGLALYDPDLHGVRGGRARVRDRRNCVWVVLAPNGALSATYTDPADFCAALQLQLASLQDPRALRALWARHAAAVEILRRTFPELTGNDGHHQVDALRKVYEERLRLVTRAAAEPDNPAPEGQATNRANGDASASDKPEPRRIRDQEHLRFVASHPCLICGRQPCHAHHLRFAQPRAMALKCGDQWTVPLCNVHHRALHDAGNERAWWQEGGIDPLSEAERLWEQHRTGRTNHPANAERE